MDILKLAHRLVGAHHYISAEDTGTPVEFAKKLGIAERGVFTELCLPYFLGSRNYTCLLG